MNTAFEKLSTEKKHQIIQACLEEFATNGYENTSTNKIINRAGISKGLLFHYFKNKKGLYLYLVEKSAKLINQKLYDSLSEVQEVDFFERIKKTAILKMEIFLKHPHEYHILLKTFFDTPKDLQEDIGQLFQKLQQQTAESNDKLLFSYLTEKDLRVGLTREFALEYVMTVMEQFNRTLLKQYQGQEDVLLKDPEPLLERLNQYMDVIKYGVYRQ